MAEQIAEKVSEFRSKRFFDNFDFINTSLAEGKSENVCLRYIQYRNLLTIKIPGGKFLKFFHEFSNQTFVV